MVWGRGHKTFWAFPGLWFLQSYKLKLCKDCAREFTSFQKTSGRGVGESDYRSGTTRLTQHYKKLTTDPTAHIARASNTIVGDLHLNGYIEKKKKKKHSLLGLGRHQQGTAPSVLHAAQGAQDSRQSARQPRRFRDQRSVTETFQTDGPLAPDHRHQAPQLCPGHNTHAAGVTGLEPPLRSIRR